jgi:hypothetical protein
MRRVATFLGIAVAVLLLLPWQICACSEDGPHLKMLWDTSECEVVPLPGDEPANGPADEDSHPECEDLFFLAGARAGVSVVAATPFDGGFILPALEPLPASHAAGGAVPYGLLARVVTDGLGDPGPSLLRTAPLLV